MAESPAASALIVASSVVNPNPGDHELHILDDDYPIPTLNILAEVWSDHQEYPALVE